MSGTAKKKKIVDMSVKVGGRIVTPALPVVDASPPSPIELTFDASLRAFTVEHIPLETTQGLRKRERALNLMGQIARDWIQHVCQKRGLPKDVAESAGGQLFTSGSYRLGVHEPGADIDTILVAPNMCTRTDFFGEVLEEKDDGTPTRRDPYSLAERIRLHPDVTNFVPVEGAAVPILTFDWEGVNIDLLFARLNSASVPATLDIDHDAVLDGVDSATEKSVNGPRVTNLIAALVSGTPERYQTFLSVVRCVRKWAKARGLYSNKMGYWGGVNINIAVALCVQLYPEDVPASLLRKFFLVFKSWRWPNPVMLTKPHDAGLGLVVWSAQHAHRQVAPIITPAYPAMNSTLAVSRQTLQILHEEFCRGHDIVDTLWRQHQADPKMDLNWKELFQPSDFFIAYPNYLSLCIVGPTQTDAQAWAGFVESRFRKLVSDLLGRSLPLSKIQLWPKKLEACVADKGALLTRAQRENCLTYFVGFKVDTMRMRGSQLNVELSMNNFREWELSKFQPLIPGMDLVVKSFHVKELPKEVFEAMGTTKLEAMKRRRQLRDADPKRQEQRRLHKLQELKEKMAARTAAILKKKEEEEAAAAAATSGDDPLINEQDESAVGGGENKRKRDENDEGAGDDDETTAKLIKKESGESIVIVPKEESTEGIQEDEEADLLENVLDVLQAAEGETKTREEAEADRQKLLAGELMDAGEMPLSDDEEDTMAYLGEGARQAYVVNRNNNNTSTKHTDTRSLPLEKDEEEILRKIGCPVVSDDEAKILGGGVVHPWRNPVDLNIQSATIKFRRKFDVVELDRNGHIIDTGDDDYEPSVSWRGRVAGFEFKLGERGLGYYRTGKKVVIPSNTAY